MSHADAGMATAVAVFLCWILYGIHSDLSKMHGELIRCRILLAHLAWWKAKEHGEADDWLDPSL